MSEWISVAERLPIKEYVVLVYNGMGIFVAYHYIDRWIRDGTTGPVIGVTHWQPLPEPPHER